MKQVQLFNVTTGTVVGEKIWQAKSFWSRLRGLLGKEKLTPGEGLWLIPCRQVHMLGMRYPLSVWFIDDKGKVCAIVDELPPGAISPLYRMAHSAVEFPAGWAKLTNTNEGDMLLVAS